MSHPNSLERRDNVLDDPRAVLIVGGRGEFGRFLQRDILPKLGVGNILTIERDTPCEQHLPRLRQARHIILATPLAGYAERACEIVEQCRELQTPTTFWLISSVQAGLCHAVTTTLASIGNPQLAAVFAHPMYGPNGFEAKEQEANTFRNILTATAEGIQHPLVDEVNRIVAAFRDKLSIETTVAFNAEEHDRITAYSQGLSYCVGQVMFGRPEIDERVRTRLPDLHNSFHANRGLINDFLHVNAYIPEVAAIFAYSWQQTGQSTYEDLLQAFARADRALSRGVRSPIPTKWYEKLRAAAADPAIVG